MVGKCPSTNTAEIEQDHFFLNFHFNNQLQPHEIGWLIAGAAAAITCILSLSNVIAHAHTYTRPLEQRQIIRILLFAPIYAVVSFFGYRYFREYEYFELGEVAMEAIAISAFLILLLQYIGDALEDQRAVFGKKEKTKMPFPFNCWRYRPSKAYFLVLLKWSVLQYVLIRPLLSIAGVILQYFDLLCTQTYSYKYGEVYLAAVDFVSISIALYGLIVLYALLREDLNGRKPLSKFLTIKLAIFFTFYQSFVFGILQDHGILKETEYWTSTNIANGLNALCTSLEMIIVAVWQLFAFPASEYSLKNLAKPRKIPKKKNKKKGKKQKEGESNEDDDNVGEGAQDMELSHTPNEQSAIATQGALPGHSPSALDEFDRNNNNNNFLAPPQRPPINHAHTPSFLQQQSQQDRLRGESHVIPGTSVGRTNARGHTNILRSLLHALNLSDFAVELWHSLRFAIDRIRGKEYTREDMRFGKGKFDFMVFQQHEREGGGRAGDGSMGVQPMGDHRLLTSATGTGLALGSAAASGRAEMSGYTNSYYSGSTAHPGRAPSVAGTLDSSQLHQNNVVGGIGGGGPGPSSLSRMMASSSSNTDVGAGGGGKDAGSYQPLQDRMDSPAQGRGYALPPAEAGYGNHQQGQEQYEMYAPTQYHNYTFSGGGNAGAGGMGVPRQSMSGTATSTAVDSLGSPVVAHSPLGAGAGAGPGITGFYERNSQGQKVEIGGPSPSNSAATTLNGVGRKSMNAARDSTEVRMNSFAFPNSSSASSIRSAGAGAGRNGEDGGDEGIYGGVEGPPTIVYPAGQGEEEGMYPHQHQHQA
ncbi:unnamed protein product [Tilletia controversa]|nr:unnamed protein product [Tilletia controversa]